MGMGESKENKGMKQGQEEMGHFISVCMCVCLHKYVFVFLCCGFVCFICRSAKHRE